MRLLLYFLTHPPPPLRKKATVLFKLYFKLVYILFLVYSFYIIFLNLNYRAKKVFIANCGFTALRRRTTVILCLFWYTLGLSFRNVPIPRLAGNSSSIVPSTASLKLRLIFWCLWTSNMFPVPPPPLLLVLLDLSAEFDTIHHDKLIGSLEPHLRNNWQCAFLVKSYPSDWFHRVSVNGSLSDQFPLKRGSCLGAFLFTIYMRKLFQIVERHLPQVHCYADDTQLCVLLWSILKVTFKTDLSYLLSLVFVLLSLAFVHEDSFPVLFFCFYLYLNSCSAREFTYCRIRNVIRLALSDVSFLQEVVFVVLELTLVLGYLSELRLCVG